MPSTDVDHKLRICLAKYRPAMEGLLKRSRDTSLLLKSWVPDASLDSVLVDHLTSLNIPTTDNGHPCLLLHNLGQTLDEATASRIKSVFSGPGHSLVINTSGSGKTRLILEGLCLYWGLYFVGTRDSEGIGSNDLYSFVSGLDMARDYKRAQGMANATPSNAQAIQHIHEVAERRLLQVFLARLLAMNFLIEEAKTAPGGLDQKNHRRLWTILQARPRILPLNPQSDIFMELADILRLAATEDLRSRIRDQYTEFQDLLNDVPNSTGEENNCLFCVLDEAQVTTTLRKGEFFSSNGRDRRPILREIWGTWRSELGVDRMKLIISGTGINLVDLKNVLESESFKPQDYTFRSDVGAFDQPKEQDQYIKKYIPAPWTETKWRAFLNRAWEWFGGRYRLTAALVSFLLAGGFVSPHRTINGFVREVAEFTPTDGDRWVAQEAALSVDFQAIQCIKFQFQKMTEPHKQLLAKMLRAQLFSGMYRPQKMDAKGKLDFIQYGFARAVITLTKDRPSVETIVIDERIPALIALKYLNNETSNTLFAGLYGDIFQHSPHGNGFEQYLAFYMRVAFEYSPTLDTIFHFRSDFAQRRNKDLKWQRRKFNLVTIWKGLDESDSSISIVTPSCGPSANLGFKADSIREVWEWIQFNREKRTFCFPPESMGPDLLFFVQSESTQRTFLISLQAKARKSIDAETLRHGVRSVTPSLYWKSKKVSSKKDPASQRPRYVGKRAERLLAAETPVVLASIPQGFRIQGADYPVLRIFASWEGEDRIERTTPPQSRVGRAVKWVSGHLTGSKNKEKDHDPHPIAGLHRQTFQKITGALDQQHFIGSSKKGIFGLFSHTGDEEGSHTGDEEDKSAGDEDGDEVSGSDNSISTT
ncbi:hypothetical protein CPB86DRAFT_820309 [Serendipita vermifera]|nr:hypothetical protein CPB86DRAFT_820309 [Serendipita vermifera]